MSKASRATAVAGALLMLAGAFGGALASSHREAPFTKDQPPIDLTDLYAWRTAGSTVTMVMNAWPFEEPAGGPLFFGFQDRARYEFNIDQDGDGFKNISYRFVFTTHVRNGGTILYNTGAVTSPTDPDLNVYQTYDVSRVNWEKTPVTSTLVGNDLPVPAVNVGPRSTPNYPNTAAAAVRNLSNGRKVFAGQRDDPFFVDLGAIFDLIKIRDPGVDTLKGFNVQTIALQVPIADLRDTDDPVVGIWATTSMPSTRALEEDGDVIFTGPYVQTSRLGNPLVNEVVIPIGKKDRFNASLPHRDAQFATHVLNSELAKRINQLYPGVFNAPETNRQDLVQVFLTGIAGLNRPKGTPCAAEHETTCRRPSEMLRLNTSIPPCTADSLTDTAGTCSRLGVIDGDKAGFPNGRRPGDDVVDISERVVGGELLGNAAAKNLTDNVDRNDKAFKTTFPYIAVPHQGYRHSHHPIGGA
ncbi:MAG: DUF4331 domain-containing protein [Chloroflexi bacterium]|nr:DUF4331 domain-containing protein [Chloroflexota bacterium]